MYTCTYYIETQTHGHSDTHSDTHTDTHTNRDTQRQRQTDKRAHTHTHTLYICNIIHVVTYTHTHA